jgi:hypothetical protein
MTSASEASKRQGYQIRGANEGTVSATKRDKQSGQETNKYSKKQQNEQLGQLGI